MGEKCVVISQAQTMRLRGNVDDNGDLWLWQEDLVDGSWVNIPHVFRLDKESTRRLHGLTAQALG